MHTILTTTHLGSRHLLTRSYVLYPAIVDVRRLSKQINHSKKKQCVQVVHVRRDARSAQEIVTLRASPSSVQESVQEILVVCNLETLGNCPLSCCERRPRIVAAQNEQRNK